MAEHSSFWGRGYLCRRAGVCGLSCYGINGLLRVATNRSLTGQSASWDTQPHPQSSKPWGEQALLHAAARVSTAQPAASLTGVLATALAAGEVPSARGLSGLQLTEHWALGSGQEGRGSARPGAHSLAKAPWRVGGEGWVCFLRGPATVWIF